MGKFMKEENSIRAFLKMKKLLEVPLLVQPHRKWFSMKWKFCHHYQIPGNFWPRLGTQYGIFWQNNIFRFQKLIDIVREPFHVILILERVTVHPNDSTSFNLCSLFHFVQSQNERKDFLRLRKIGQAKNRTGLR